MPKSRAIVWKLPESVPLIAIDDSLLSVLDALRPPITWNPKALRSIAISHTNYKRIQVTGRWGTDGIRLSFIRTKKNKRLTMEIISPLGRTVSTLRAHTFTELIEEVRAIEGDSL